jgi:hypothetical protein
MSTQDEIAERAAAHLSQFAPVTCMVKGFLFVDDAWLAGHREGADYQLETDPEVIEYIKETWTDLGAPGSAGTEFSPCDARPHCVAARTYEGRRQRRV